MTDLEISINCIREARAELEYWQRCCDSVTRMFGERAWHAPHPLDRDKRDRRDLWAQRLANVMGRLATELRDSAVEGHA